VGTKNEIHGRVQRLKAAEALIAWTDSGSHDLRTCGQVKVGPLIGDGEHDWTDGEGDWRDRFECTGGAAYDHRRSMTGIQQQLHVLMDFHDLVVHYGIDPKLVHREFLKIDEYLKLCADGCGELHELTKP
jgi:hypothetical protein